MPVETETLDYPYKPSVIAEFSGSTGSLSKEYIYGASGLLATIEPTAINSNGTRYTTADHLGSPRVVTNSSASVISRHDYMPFGEELGAGIGGRTTGIGFPGSTEGIRQKFIYRRNGMLRRMGLLPCSVLFISARTIYGS